MKVRQELNVLCIAVILFPQVQDLGHNTGGSRGRV